MTARRLWPVLAGGLTAVVCSVGQLPFASAAGRPATDPPSATSCWDAQPRSSTPDVTDYEWRCQRS
ncbi:MAG TPA: hypothetical protein VFU43_25245 [Streptosporangiaceae bacterium]|nr:hypothetical protein [Streptosporangiaceae bacterium]